MFPYWAGVGACYWRWINGNDSYFYLFIMSGPSRFYLDKREREMKPSNSGPWVTYKEYRKMDEFAQRASQWAAGLSISHRHLVPEDIVPLQEPIFVPISDNQGEG